jgi:hypothetical protein
MKNPVSLTPAPKPETGFFPKYLIQTFNLGEKPGFFNPRAKTRNRVFYQLFGSNLRFRGKTRFL